MDYAGGVNADAIRGEILQNVEGVYSAIVYENDTDETDALGLPRTALSHRLRRLDADIAQAIFRRKAAGIQTSGSSSIAVIAKSGQSINIKFSRPTTVAVYIQIKNLETNSDFPGDGQDRIKEALVEYIGGDVRGGRLDAEFRQRGLEVESVDFHEVRDGIAAGTAPAAGPDAGDVAGGAGFAQLLARSGQTMKRSDLPGSPPHSGHGPFQPLPCAYSRAKTGLIEFEKLHLSAPVRFLFSLSTYFISIFMKMDRWTGTRYRPCAPVRLYG